MRLRGLATARENYHKVAGVPESGVQPSLHVKAFLTCLLGHDTVRYFLAGIGSANEREGVHVMRSTMSRTLFAAAVVAGSLTVMPAAQAAAGDAPPSCVKTKVSENGDVLPKEIAKVTNSCSTSKRVRVIWKTGNDGNCVTIGAGKSNSWRAPSSFAGYDKTVMC